MLGTSKTPQRARKSTFQVDCAGERDSHIDRERSEDGLQLVIARSYLVLDEHSLG